MAVTIPIFRPPSVPRKILARDGTSTRTSGCSRAWQRKQASAFLSTWACRSGAVENMTRPSLLKMRIRSIPCFVAIVSMTS